LFHVDKNIIKLVKACTPKSSEFRKPFGGSRHLFSLQPRRAALFVDISLNQPGPFKHLQMPRYRWLTYFKWRCDLIYRGLTICQSREDRPSRRISQRRKNGVEI